MKALLFKKKNAVILSLFLIFFSSGILTSCKDDDESSVGMEQLQGTWVFDKGTTYAMGYTTTISRSELQEIGRQWGVTFWDETLTFSGNKVNGVEYSIDGDKFNFVGMEDFGGLTSSIAVNGDRLVFHYDFGSATVDLEYVKQ